MSRETVLEVRDLRVSLTRTGTEIVAGAALTARRGEIVGIVGESGSGKSLTLRSIAGLLPAGLAVSGGEIHFGDRELAGASAETLRSVRGRGIGMVFQEPMTALNPTMRIGEQIGEGPRLHQGLSTKAAHQRAVELLERVGIRDPERCARLFPHELSGGMRQRAMIAIALSCSPPLVLCDEPTTALDATVTHQVLDLLVELAGDLDLAIVLVTHDLGVVARTCSRIVVMYAGTVLEEGPTDEVLRRPRHPYTHALLQAVPTRDRTLDDLRAIPGRPPDPSDRPQGCPFAPRCAFAEPACEEPVALTTIEPGRATACRRHELLSVTRPKRVTHG